ncbi:P-loop containing nucleoside triphosphate hydrolase protein [Melampsora americana]|nr:P-loop containing nucleoside triphosphate hydrolase protein [Melampsora americana]
MRFIPPRYKACRNLLDSGSCPIEDCPYQHKLIHCEPCRVFVTTQFSYNQHLNGKQHRQVTAQLQVLAPQLVNHLPKPQGPRCEICDVYTPNPARHASTLRHIKRARYERYREAVRDSEMDKHGIAIYPIEINFGSLDTRSVRENKSKFLTQTIKIINQRSYHESIVWLKGIKTLSARSRQGHSSVLSKFHPQVIEFPLQLDFHNSNELSIEINFQPKGITGKHVDTLEFYFEIPETRDTFKISRSLLAIVSDEALMAELKPVGSYVPSMWLPSTEIADEIVDGIMPPPLAAVRWTSSLPFYDLPRWVTRGLSSTGGGIRKTISWAKNAGVLPSELSLSTYSKWWQGILWIEEVQMKEDIRRYDMKGVSITRVKNDSLYSLEVPGLAEKRPSVLYGDQVLFRPSGDVQGIWYGGRVHKVEATKLQLKFDPSFSAFQGQKFDVQFSLCRTVLRRMHQAIMLKAQQSQSIFPDLPQHRILSGPTEAERKKLHFFNRNFETNPPQQDAIANILNRRHPEVPFIVFGPPGTGKTAVLVEAVLQLCEKPLTRILMAAPSNAAADQLALRLLQAGLKASLFRLCAPTRATTTLTPGLEKVVCRNGRDGPFCTPELEVLKNYRVVISTCLSAGVLAGVGVPAGHYTHVMIDEAGQAMEPEVMVPMKTLQKPDTQIILAGDPHQLGPIVRSPVATALGLHKSLLSRFIESKVYHMLPNRYSSTISKLTQNYRSHPAILDFPNKRFYEGDLTACADVMLTTCLERWEELPIGKIPIVFHNVPGEDLRESGSPSFFNLLEVVEVKRYIVSLKEDRRFRLTDQDIGVITPYNAQASKIRIALKQYPKIKVGTVEEFQGQERRVIVLSTVRSNQEYLEYDLKFSLGFVSNRRRMNVAITRAQAALVIIGDASVLKLDPLWKQYLSTLSIKGCWKGQPINWDAEDYLYPSSDESGTSEEMSESDTGYTRPRLQPSTRKTKVRSVEDDHLFLLTGMVQTISLEDSLSDEEDYEIVDKNRTRRLRYEAMADKDWSTLE